MKSILIWGMSAVAATHLTNSVLVNTDTQLNPLKTLSKLNKI